MLELTSPTTLNELLISNLRRLMRESDMNEAELSRKTSVPQPTLHKILTGKTEDPRASTLKAVAAFFNVSMDSLFSETNTTLQTSAAFLAMQAIPIISWSDCLEDIKFISGLTSANWEKWIGCDYLAPNAYALLSKPCMERCFPKDSVLLIAPHLEPKDGDVLVVHYPETKEATLRELVLDGPTMLLHRVNIDDEPTPLGNDIKILGVLMRTVLLYR